MKKEKTESIKSTKRVLLKTKIIKDTKSRTLRSGVTIGSIDKSSKSKQSPRTRSQKKKQNTKRDPSKSKRKVISKLVESIK
jgi:hypothetical protein